MPAARRSPASTATARSPAHRASRGSTTRRSWCWRSPSTMSGVGGWSIQQLVEFLAAVSSREDGAATMHTAVERAAEALEAEVGALVVDGQVATSVGFAAGEVPAAELVAAADGAECVELPGLGACAVATAPVTGPRKKTLILARAGGEPFGRPDINLLRGMARV